jgi:hypothetical protein
MKSEAVVELVKNSFIAGVVVGFAPIHFTVRVGHGI